MAAILLPCPPIILADAAFLNSKVLLAENLNFKPRIAFLEYFFWKFGDAKNESLFLKKGTFIKSRSLGVSGFVLLNSFHLYWVG